MTSVSFLLLGWGSAILFIRAVRITTLWWSRLACNCKHEESASEGCCLLQNRVLLPNDICGTQKVVKFEPALHL